MSVVSIDHLSTGLTVITDSSPHAESVSFGIAVATGARDERPDEAGVSHFLEHMVFKGTERRSSLDITYRFGELGAQANAFTSEEFTFYYASVVKSAWREVAELITDMMQPKLDREEFDVEKKVILEEIALYRDRPSFTLAEEALADFMAGHPTGNSVLGSDASIRALSRDAMADYHRRRYRTGGMAVVVSGAVSRTEVLQEVERLTAPFPQGEVPRARPAWDRRGVGFRKKRTPLEQAQLLLLVPACSATDPRRYAADIAALILGDGGNSRIFWELVDSGLCDEAGFDLELRDGVGLGMASASSRPERIDDVADRLARLLSESGKVTEAEVVVAKTKIASRFVLGLETPYGRMVAHAQTWIHDRAPLSVAQELAAFQAVTVADVARVAEELGWSRKDMVRYQLTP